MAIENPSPVTIPAQDAVTFDTLWVYEIRINATQPENPNNVTAMVHVAPAKAIVDGTFETRKPGTKFYLKDVYGEAAAMAGEGDPSLAMAIEAIMAAIPKLYARQLARDAAIQAAAQALNP